MKKQNIILPVSWEKIINTAKLVLLIFILEVCFSGFSVYAAHTTETNEILQTGKITGVVKDLKGEPLAGASVVIQGTSIGVTTNIQGVYSLDAEEGKSLVVSYLGFVTQTVKAVNNQTIVLVEDDNLLNEVVVVGYGVQKKINMTGAVATVDSKALANRPIQNVSTALQGLMSGVTVQSGQGRPGQDGATIRVRGLGTLNTSYASPYVLIDGIETGTMNSIDPNDIESISVLKDAASAAIYGSKAANGVILITTKRGKAGDKPTITYSGYYGIQNATNMIERLNSYDYARLYNNALIEDDKTARFSDGDIQKFKDGSDPYGHSNTDWYDLAFKTGSQHQHNVNISGGNDKMNYMASVGFLNQEGILPHSNRTQFNGRTNLDVKVSDRMNLRINLAYIKNDYKDPTNSYVRGGSDQIIRQLNVIAPWITNRYEDGTYGTVSDGNPIAWLDLDQTEDRFNQNFSGLIAGDYQIIDGLKASLSGSYTGNIQHYRQFMKDIQYNPNKYHGPAYLNENYYLWYRYNFDATLEYEKSFGKHGIKVLAGWHTEKYDYNENTMSRNTFPNNNLTDMNAGSSATQTNGGFSRALAMVSGFGRINYDYAGKYLLEANFRADASSRFSPENRWGYFPSFSAGWRISEENFMAGTRDWLNNLKIRGSYGLLGDQGANGDYYPWINTYNLSGSYPFDGRLETGYYQSSFKIESFSWEKSRTWGIAVDASFLNSFNVSVDYYDRRTTDIIMDVPVPAEFGLGAYKANIGSVSNKGLELSLGYNKQWGDFNLSAIANVSYNKNEILDLGEDVTQMISGNTIRRLGGKVDAFYVYETDGLFRSPEEVDAFTAKYNRETGTTMFTRAFKPGDIRYVDTNNDGKINADDRVLCNSTTPDYIFGLNLTAGYKQFDLSMVLSGVAGASRIYSNETFGTFRGDTSHPATYWLDAWTPENSKSDVPRIWNDVSSNSDPQNVMSTFWLQNTSFLRMKNLQLGYSFPESALKFLNVSKLRVFYSVENLFTLDTMPINLDPETNSERASSYPLVKTHSFGLSLTF
ncbi:MAG: TonB-dependent receptor [Dysgonamonadaceae bacterium]|jgi:TonB-linked SusC/RagA family outer membrane protein|nr:TonB-dependent receptor [Dysgonamonadaceae bacterium]